MCMYYKSVGRGNLWSAISSFAINRTIDFFYLSFQSIVILDVSATCYMTFFPIDRDLRPIAEKKLHHVQNIGMVLPNICMSQDMFCIFMWLSVETCINHKNSSSNLDLKTCFLRIYISFSFVSYRQSMCLFFFFFFLGLCFLGGHIP